MAMPMSAFFSAGASFTPSPVMATTWPSDWSDSTMRSFWSGVTRANTDARVTVSARAASSIGSISAPFTDTGSGMSGAQVWCRQS